MKFHRRQVIIITLLVPLVTLLLIEQLKCNIRYENDKIMQSNYLWRMSIECKHHTKVSKYYIPLQDVNELQDVKVVNVQEMSQHMLNISVYKKGYRAHVIEIPMMCSENNCLEFLSKEESEVVSECKELTIEKEHLDNSFNRHTCSFLPEMGRHPIALVSAPGSGNTWTRGLLERATGICTGSVWCDNVLKSHGFIGECIKSGKVLVVKTHQIKPQRVERSNMYMEGIDPTYSSAVFILRNPVMSAIAEWNRKASVRILGKQNSSIRLESHTYRLPSEFFGGEAWDSFLHHYLMMWKDMLMHWVITQDTHPVHVLRYEDLQRNTVGEVGKILDFLNVSYSPNVLAVRLIKDYSEFHRPHQKESFEHYSVEQKQLLRSVITDTIKLAERKGKAELLRLNDYLLTIQ